MHKEDNVYLKMRNYNVDHINFKMNNNFNFSQEMIEIVPEFGRKIKQLDENLFEVSLKIVVPEKNVPFYLDIQIDGYFEISKKITTIERKILIEDNTVAILFPFLRSIVASVTSTGSLPPYVLPVMNIAEMFKLDKKQD